MIEHPGGIRERRYLNIVFFSFGLFCLTFLARTFVADHYERTWAERLEAETDLYLEEATKRFASLQRETRRLTTDLTQVPALFTYLRGASPDLVSVFEAVAEAGRKYDVGIEVYEKDGSLIAWSGISGPVSETEIRRALQGELISYVVPSTLHSQLFVATPVRNGPEIVGVVLVRKTIDTHYPLNNRYIGKAGLTETVNEELGLSVRFSFGQQETVPVQDRYKAAPLYGIDSMLVGRVSVMVPEFESFMEKVDGRFRIVYGILAVAGMIPMIMLTLNRIRNIPNSIPRTLSIVGLIWLTRYLLLLLEIPSGFFSQSVFDPVFYASTFGSGLAKSIGELTITCAALILTSIVLSRYVIRDAASLPRGPVAAVIGFAGSALIVALLFLLLRGYGEVIRSAVFDASLSYTDPTVVIPPFELALMVINLFTISLSLIVFSVGLIFLSVTIAGSGRIGGWIVTGGWLVIGSLLFGYTRSHPILTVEYRLVFSAGLLLYTYSIMWRMGRTGDRFTPGNLLIPLALSAVLLYMQLDARGNERDRERVEVFAAEFLRPVDSWLTFVVNEALEDFRSEEVLDVLHDDVAEEVDRLALTVWARSSACREGYSSLFFITDSAGRELSRFRIGDASLLPERGLSRNPPREKTIRISEFASGVNAIKVYRGAIPLVANGRILGHAFVLVAAGQQTLFRGDIPAFLRSPSPESLESFHRPIAVAEFRSGELLASTGEILPVWFRLPAEVRREIEEGGRSSFWTDLMIGGEEFETFLVRGSSDESQIFALALPAKGVYVHFFNLMKVLVYYTLIVLIVMAGYTVVRWFGGRPLIVTFRDKLLVALLITAVAPLIVIAYYGRGFAEERLMEQTRDRLQRETEAVAFQISAAGGPDLNLTPAEVENIAADVGTDFNLYSGTRLISTSRPELYDAGLLDRRLSGSAYASMVLQGERFFHQTENVGRFRYAVGYRPLFDDNRQGVGIISVPTIYRQNELDLQVSQQNAFLFGVYSFVFLAIIVVASTVASRIASPIHRLTEATRRVSQGDLNVTVGVSRGEGEISELIRSFESMTQNLKRQRDELVRYERELAWKEMAKQVAHEIKNPLTPMKLSLQHLRQTYRDKVDGFDAILEEIVRGVIDQIDSLSRIASEFSRFAQMPRAQHEECDANEIVEDALRLVGRTEGLTFEKKLAEPVLPIVADKEELRRAFANIIKNGIQAMSNGGRMVVQTTRDGDTAVIRFRDFGTGIADEIKEKLFQPNFSTKTEGMGLGLAIVKKTLDDLGGTITIESRLGEGTEVIVRLNLRTSESDAEG